MRDLIVSGNGTAIEREHMACLLSARGKGFKVDEFLRDSPLKPHAVWRKGEVIGRTSRDLGRGSSTPGSVWS